MSASDWYARRLGQQPPAPAQPVSTPGTDPYLARHSQPSPAYAPPPQTAIQGLPADVIPTDENGQMHFMDGAVRWKGGEGTRTETNRCPVCVGKGRPGTKVFSLQSQAKMNASGQTVPPASRCFECGWSGGAYVPYGGDLSS